MNNKAFSLLELIIVIAVISIIAAISFVAIDPSKRIGEANDNERLVESGNIERAIEKYAVDNHGLPQVILELENDIPYMITSEFISNSLYCSEYEEPIPEVVLGTILEDYLDILPVDPKTSDPFTMGTGYYLIKTHNFFTKVKPCYLFSGKPHIDSPSVPDPPTGLSYVSLSTHSISFEWTAPTNNGGSDIIDYIIEYKEDIEEIWQIFNDDYNTDTEVIVNNLTQSTLYNFRVVAVNIVGNSYYSDILIESTLSGSGSGGDVG